MLRNAALEHWSDVKRQNGCFARVSLGQGPSGPRTIIACPSISKSGGEVDNFSLSPATLAIEDRRSVLTLFVARASTSQPFIYYNIVSYYTRERGHARRDAHTEDTEGVAGAGAPRRERSSDGRHHGGATMLVNPSTANRGAALGVSSGKHFRQFWTTMTK